MEILSGRCRVADLKVVFSAKRKKTFQTGTGMLRALSLESMWEEQDQVAPLLPLNFGAGDKIVDNNLSGIGEIAELRFP
jgi:hypothetical protein